MLKRKKNLLFTLFSVILVLLAALIVFQFILLLAKVQSNSMDPSIKSNTYVLVNRLSYNKHIIKRGDIIAFYDNGNITTKRVVGLPGETVSFIDGYVYIDDQLLIEPYIDDNTETNSHESFEIPNNYYFVLGDNRENSLDSRYQVTTYINEDDIIGRVFYVFNDIFGTTINRYDENKLKETDSTETDNDSKDKEKTGESGNESNAENEE